MSKSSLCCPEHADSPSLAGESRSCRANRSHSTSTASEALRCPSSASIGKAVERQTVKALLTDAALRRLTPGAYRFCPDAGCDVVYFGAEGVPFATTDLRVDVWQKLPFGSRPICYCFGESERSIRDEIEATGRSSAVERIRQHISAGHCACEVRNPRGVCCLGDLTTAVARVRSVLGARQPVAEDGDGT